MSPAPDDTGADILESSHMVSIMLYLYDSGECHKSDIYDAVGRGNRMPDKLDSLRDLGLVDYNGPSDSRPVIGLTELGSQVASMLHAIDLAIRNRNLV